MLYGRKRNLATYALLDEGAASSLIEETLAEELCLKWTSQVTQTESASKYVSVGVSSMCQGATQFELKSLRTVRESEGDDVVAARCRLGWSVYGRHSDAAPASSHILHICECNEASSMRALDASMKEYFAMESSGTRVPSKPLRSKDDERALQIMKATTSYCPIDKRWQTGLLWRFDKVDLPDSYSMAMRRLQCLEAKMAKDIDLKSFMLDIMQSYEEKGYIRRLTESELDKGKSSWFLPIFTVTNPNKNKTRLVWDAAAKVNGTSLNDVLLKGPDILASLVGVLIRFRERPVVVVAGDISEMFHQVRVRPEDQTAQKFLWRSGNSAKAAETNTFVDDWLESTNTEDEMTELAMEVQRIHLEGGFNMRRWTSNSASVVRALKNQEGDVPRENIWRAGTYWDESLQEKDWKIWVKLLPKINEVRISRCMPKVCCARQVQLHTFVDASINAYAALVYLRAEVDGIVHCSLVASKTQVAPLKPVSIPRMELMAAVLGLRLAKFIEPELSVTVCQRIFWTDSKDVLCWIRSDARKYNQFVALRVGEILEDSDVLSWRWVPTQHNVADDGTKWTKMPDMTGNSRWFVGPRFLYEQETQWPSMEQSPSKTSESILHHEEKVKGNSSLACITPDPERFGTLEKLRAVQKRVLNFLQGICKRPCGEQLMNILAINRDVETDAVFIRACQEEEFPEEIRCLNQGHGITNRKSKLFKCTTYLDELGVLRIKGRIDRIEGVDMDTKRPIILPQKHRVTFLIVEYYHRKNYHLHNEIVVNEVRQLYWITGLRALAFVARRGVPRTILSDNGTNFRGASRVLKEHIIVDDAAKRNTWPKGRVIDVHRRKDGQVRSAVVRTVDGLVTRPTVKLAVLNLESNPPHEDAEQMEARAATYRLSLETLPPIIAILLTGRAESWWQTSGYPEMIWVDFKSEFLEFFLPPRYFEKLEDSIRARKQRHQEPYKEYLVDLRLIMKRAHYSTLQELDRMYENLLPD
ncbi:uncharacterized protein [Drosophila tropicalis]|uniref:uncharacterized protein n=1 Tax=Drosophila tropicalis TaxID=46794 RepID=UPI0035ABD8B1